MDKKWTALVPQRSLVSSKTGKPLLSARLPRLIGRLPEDAYLELYLYIGLGDIVNLARCCRKVAALARDERVWKRKLVLLDYRGPEPPGVDKLREAVIAASTSTSTLTRSGSVSNKRESFINGHHATPHSRTCMSDSAKRNSTSAINGKRSSYAARNAASPIIPETEEGGFGDFIDSTPVTAGFASIDLDEPPPAAVRRKEEELLMLFDDEEDMGLATATPAKPVSQTKANGFNNGHARTSSISRQIHQNSPSPSHDLFVAYYKILVPFYNSLKLHSTTSLLFTSPHLTSLSRGQLLSTLYRLVSCPEISPPLPRSSTSTSTPSSSFAYAFKTSTSSSSQQSQMTIIKRNLQSSIDHFESSQLSLFQKAADENLHSGMREAAAALWELPSTSTSGSRRGRKGESVVQVFLEKIPLFYDQSWDPLKNLTKTIGPSGELVDGIDFQAMDGFMNHVLAIVAREGKTIARVFPKDSDVLVQFAERISNDVVGSFHYEVL